MWGSQAANLPHLGRGTTFPSACDRLVCPRSSGFGQFVRHAQDGGAFSRKIAAKTALNLVLVMAISANWKAIARAWRTFMRSLHQPKVTTVRVALSLTFLCRFLFPGVVSAQLVVDLKRFRIRVRA